MLPRAVQSGPTVRRASNLSFLMIDPNLPLLRGAGAVLALTLLSTLAPGQGRLPVLTERVQGRADVLLFDLVEHSYEEVATRVKIESLELVGYPAKDRLRLSGPWQARTKGMKPFVFLPGGGALYRLKLEHGDDLLHIDATGEPRLLFDDEPDLRDKVEKQIHVSSDGLWLLVETKRGDGQLLVFDLASEAPPVDIGLELDKIEPKAKSLRVSRRSAWFVQKDRLYRADLLAGTPARPVDLGPGAENWKLEEEILLAPAGDRVAVVAKVSGKDRHVFVVPIEGPAVRLTEEPGEYETVGNNHRLGPRMAFSPDGNVLGFLRTDDHATELFAKDIQLPALQPVHLTQEPDFPLYIDNVGFLAFGGPRVLCFFGGDTELSDAPLGEELGAAEMYSVDVSNLPHLVFTNVTLTNGQTIPPFDVPAKLEIAEAIVDPLGQRFFLIGETQYEGKKKWSLSMFRVSGPMHVLGVTPIAEGLEERPTLVRGGVNALAVLEYKEHTDLLQIPRDGLGPMMEIPLSDWPKKTELSRFTVSRGGQRVGFVAKNDGEQPFVVNLETGTCEPALPAPVKKIAPLMVFGPTGRLVVALEFSGDLEFLSLGATGSFEAGIPPTKHGHPLAF